MVLYICVLVSEGGMVLYTRVLVSGVGGLYDSFSLGLCVFGSGDCILFTLF